jgi:transcriptional regulator with XRE-family HTH domain
LGTHNRSRINNLKLRACAIHYGRKQLPVSAVGGSTVYRRELGVALRALRQNLGLTVEQAAEQLLCSPSKIARIEAGQRSAAPRDVRDLCNVYGVSDPDEQARLVKLAAKSSKRDWWQAYDLTNLATYVGLEVAAERVGMYQAAINSGVLRDSECAPTLRGRPEMSAKCTEGSIEVRLRGRDLLRPGAVRAGRPRQGWTVYARKTKWPLIARPGRSVA